MAAATDASLDVVAATDVEPADTGTDASDALASGDVTEGSTDATDAGDAGNDVTSSIQGPLRGYWRLDEGSGTLAADSTPNGGDGTLFNGATWTTSGFPAAMFTNPAALVLDGVDDYVQLGVAAIPRNEEAKTVSLWFWQAAPSTAAARENIVALTDFAIATGTQIGLDAGHASVWFMGEATALVTDPTAAAAGWHHLAYTYGGAIHRLYVDAVLVGQITRASAAAPVMAAFLGGFDVLGLELFGGRIDDVRIYDSALSLATITAINGGAAP
jgi:Concanavalin A-like lectin/glucanases superfamily